MSEKEMIPVIEESQPLSPLIYGKIADILAEIPAIGKEKENTMQHFMYRGIDDVMNVMNPLFAKHRVFLVPTVLDHKREERVNSKGTTLIYSVLRVAYRLFAEDGSFVEAIVDGEGMDSGDKATNKAMAISMKYALFQIFCIPTEEMSDPDADTPGASDSIASLRQKIVEICKEKAKDGLRDEAIAVIERLNGGNGNPNSISDILVAAEVYSEIKGIKKTTARKTKEAN